MVTFPKKEVEELNDFLWKTLGPEGEDFPLVGGKRTLNILLSTTDEVYLKLFRIIHFYHPRRIAHDAIYNAFEECKAKYAEFAACNELLIALTSIADWLANSKGESSGWQKRFVSFLEKNLSKRELKKLIASLHICDSDKQYKELKSLDEFARYIYRVRSWVVHNAELGGMYPYVVALEGFWGDEQTTIRYMIEPRIFRLLLWKAIFTSLGLKLLQPIVNQTISVAKPS